MNMKQERQACFSVAPPAIDKCSPFHAERKWTHVPVGGCKEKLSFFGFAKNVLFSSSLKKIYIRLR